MASSPDGVRDDEVRWPLVAWIGIGLAALTIVAAVVAALFAVFVVDRDEPAVEEERSALLAG